MSNRPPLEQSIGRRIARCRFMAGCSMTELARLADMGWPRLEAIEKNWADPTPAELERIASILNQPIEFFTGPYDDTIPF